MSIREEITNQLKQAMINKNTNLVNTLRLIKASIKDKDIIAKGNGKGDISDQEIISVLQTMIKQRKASIDMYLSGNREDLVKKEENEIEIISNFLPQQLSLQEIDIIINDMIISSGASSIKYSIYKTSFKCKQLIMRIYRIMLAEEDLPIFDVIKERFFPRRSAFFEYLL